MVVAQIATVVWGAMNIEQLHELFKANMEKTVAEDYGVSTTDTSAFDVIQKDVSVI